MKSRSKAPKSSYKSPKPENLLVGRFFHSIGKDGYIQWQGRVLDSPEPGWYLVETFCWVMGEPYVEQLVELSTMKGWLFYPDAEAMRFSYDYGAGNSKRSPESREIHNLGERRSPPLTGAALEKAIDEGV